MKITNNTILVLFGLFAAGLIALIPIGWAAASMLAPQPQPTADTQATLQFLVTQAAPTQTLVPPPTQVVVPPPTNTPLPTMTLVPTATPVSYCDWAFFVKDVTVPDDSLMGPGETFVKTWRIKNRGTCAWTPDYMLVFNSGSAMGGTTSVRLPGYVAPGQTADVSVTLTAPLEPGDYAGYWMLRNPSGALFGAGDHANKPLFVDIEVIRPSLSYGIVSGFISYPSEFVPGMSLFFLNVDTQEVIESSVPYNFYEFSLTLPVGTYVAYAWAPGYELEGGYVYSDSTLRPFTIYGGQVTPGIVISDWQAGPHMPK